jgi:IQ domain-containing protein G
MTELNVVESERLVAIMEDAVEKLSFLDSITPDVLQHRDELSKFIGDEIQRTMNEQQALESRYEELIEKRALMKGMHNKNKYKEVQEEIQDISRALRESTNNLVRSLKENPNVSGNLIKVQRDRTELRDLFVRLNQELRDRGTYQTITHRVDEENAAKIRFNQLKTREKALRDTVERLQEQLLDEQKTFTKTTADQKLAIAQLKDELQSIKGSASTNTKFKRKESLATVASIWREFKLKERVYEDRQAELEDKLQTETVVNQQTKEFLQRKLISLQDQVNEWDTNYETDIGAIDTEMEAKTEQRDTQLVLLDDLRERRQIEIDEERELKEARDLEIKMATEAKALGKRQNLASRCIQSTMRAYIKRKLELDALAPKKKGKGDKKGKKKK